DKLAAAGQPDASRLTGLERRIADLEMEHATTTRQLEVVEQELAVTTSDLENTQNQVKSLARQLEEGQKVYLQTVQETQLQLRKQDMRLNWLAMVSGFALLLAAVASGILIWDVQKNAGLLAGMSADIKQLMNTVQQQDNQPQAAVQAEQAGVADPPFMKLPPLPDQSIGASSSTVLPETINQGEAGAALTGDIPAVTEKAPGEAVAAFFERNATMPGMVNLPSGVQYRVVRQGDGMSPGMADWVVVDYLGMTPDGSIFDSTYDSGQRAIFGMDGLLPGWQEPLLHMQEGAEFEVYVPPDIANIGGISTGKKAAGEPGIYLIELRKVVKVDAGEP
ncbi:MAG TPA: FKBP-type peptidyl-prolyl cis-trans isomerase, partial [Gammaproteobacteria bacterium]|nr:FKBP-type peptidyl-prolyl cis-trans isomerase [Gammaproteobacteria bacterium]